LELARRKTMIKRLLLGGSATAVVAMLAVALLVEPSPPQSAEPHREQADQLEASGGPSEGIHVHGHWVIEVRDPDGTVRNRVEKDNALTTEGIEILQMIFGDGGFQVEPNPFRLRLYGQDSNNHPCAGGGPWCIVCLHTDHLADCNAVVERIDGGLKYTGSVTALADGEVLKVGAVFLGTQSDGTSGVGEFTLTDITPVSVITGQSMYVTWTLTFQ
jgi:hypothetical protein